MRSLTEIRRTAETILFAAASVHFPARNAKNRQAAEATLTDLRGDLVGTRDAA